MRERPILLNSEMVKAVLDGRKTQTRRAISDKTLQLFSVAAMAGECHPLPGGNEVDQRSQSYYQEFCPFGKPGDRLWVRETFAYGSDFGEADVACFYRATDPGWDENDTAARWRPSIHMPRWASRITLEITGVRVERLNSISEEDAKAEGAPTECCVIGDKHFLGFRSLWKSIYGDESWQSNPWVWVIEFRRVEVSGE